jgi:hypothetical protein
LLVTHAPGSYTAQDSGVSNTGGICLIEVYELPWAAPSGVRQRRAHTMSPNR